MIHRGLDHLIHLVRDLDAAGAAYERLGFVVSAENRHPFGTKNRIVQLPGFFIEILAIGDHAPIPDHEPGRFSFAAFHRDRLARAGEGGSGLVLESRDAEADALSFTKAGFGGFEPFFFERRGARPDGSETHVAFELAFAAYPVAPDICFFACEHKRPENFWNPAAQAHPNGASGVAAAVLTAENPSDHHVFLSAFTGIRDFRTTSSGLFYETPRGALEVLTPAAFAHATGVGATERAEPRLSGLRLETADLEAAAKAAGGLAKRRGEALVVPADRLHGLTLVLERKRAA